MEEKILAKLDEMDQKIDAMDQKFEAKFEQMNQKFEAKFELTDKKFNILKDDLIQVIQQEISDRMLVLEENIKQEIVDRMFVFEEDYGRRLTIAYEDLTGRKATEENNSEKITKLEKRSEVNTAYVYRHEEEIQNLKRIASLEKSQ